jgi:hypothetical protein
VVLKQPQAIGWKAVPAAEQEPYGCCYSKKRLPATCPSCSQWHGVYCVLQMHPLQCAMATRTRSSRRSFSTSTFSPVLTRSSAACWHVGTINMSVVLTPGNMLPISRAKRLGQAAEGRVGVSCSAVHGRPRGEQACIRRTMHGVLHPPQRAVDGHCVELLAAVFPADDSVDRPKKLAPLCKQRSSTRLVAQHLREQANISARLLQM